MKKFIVCLKNSSYHVKSPEISGKFRFTSHKIIMSVFSLILESDTKTLCMKALLTSALLLAATFTIPGCKNDEPVSHELDRRFSETLSNSCITCIEEDSSGYMWIGTERGLNKYDGFRYEQFFHTKDSTSIFSNRITTIKQASDGILWIGTSTGISSLGRDGKFTQYIINAPSHFVGLIQEHDGNIYASTLGTLLVLDKASMNFEKVVDLKNTSSLLSVCFSESHIDIAAGNKIFRCDLQSGKVIDIIGLPYVLFAAKYDGDRYLYIGHNEGMDIVDLDTFSMTSEKITGIPVNEISVLDRDEILISSSNQLYSYDRRNLKLLRDVPVNDFTDSEISAIHIDRSGNIWLGSASKGVSVLYDYEMAYFREEASLTSSMSGKNVTSITVDKEGRVWMVADHHSLYVHCHDAVTEIDLGKMPGLKLSGQYYVSNVYADPKGDIWISVLYTILHCRYTEAHGLTILSARNIFGNADMSNLPISDYVIYSVPIQMDSEGKLWLGTVTGSFYCLPEDKAEFERYSIPKPLLTHMGAIFMLSDGNIAAGFYGRGIYILDPRKKEIIEEIPLTDVFSDRVFITAVCEDFNGNIWVGSRSEGVLRISPDRTIHQVNNLACNDICGIVCDKRGDVWISTYEGISRYNYTTGEILNYTKEDGIGGNQFNYLACAVSDNGKVYFGGTHGITVLDPAKVRRKVQKIHFAFEDLFLNNRLEIPFISDVLDVPLSECDKIVIPYNKRQVTINFSAIDYSKQYHIRYAYALDKVSDLGWIDIGRNSSISLTEVPYGRHRLFVRMESMEYPSVDRTIDMKIQVKRPLYLSHVALLFYFLILAGVVLWFISLMNSLYRVRLEQATEKKRNEMNMSFFANISHEFRTPLTMINGAIKQLESGAPDEDAESRLKRIITRNSERMTRLVNQLMDFGRLDSDVLKLRVVKTDIVPLMDRIVNEFKFASGQKDVGFSYRKGVDVIEMWLDEDKLEKTVYNILSNAFKFTKPGGKVSVDLDIMSADEAGKLFHIDEKNQNQRWCMVSIFNTGSHIPEDKLESIFERYTQLEEGARMGGTGIGLYYAKRLVGIHHGYIKAENLDSGLGGESGVSFTFILPINQESYSEEEIAVSGDRPVTKEKEVLDKVETPQISEWNNGSDVQKPTILVIDDDYEICYYLKTLLQPTYKVVDENNAEAGLKSIMELNPDIILCDVLMPGMDGYELCAKVKEDLSICHIPFVLLTAKFSIEDQIKGLEAGANTYVVKPFDPDYLLAVIRSQLAIRDKTRIALGSSTESSKVEDKIVDTLDKKFVADLYSLMEAGISQPDMDVTEMSNALHVSRSQLFYKVKALTGETPHAFFNHYKLNVAAKWILDDKYKISAIAQDLGFLSASHFSVLFKKQFGCLPSEYKRLHARTSSDQSSPQEL